MQLVRFLLVGLINTGAGLACIYAAMAAGIDYRWSNALGYVIGSGIAFVLNRSWTFRDQSGWRGSLARWLAVVLGAYLCNLLTVVVLHEGLGLDTHLAQLGGVAIYTVASYLGARSFAFRHRTPTETAHPDG